METYTDIVKRIIRLEEELGLYQYKIANVPIWDIVRGKYRNNYVIKGIGMTQASYQKRHSVLTFLKSFVISLWQGLKIFVCSGHIDTVFYGFPRLEKIDEYYVDKFIEPIISSTNISDNYLYLEAGKGGVHRSPRQIDNIVWVESLNIISWIMGIIISPLYYVWNLRVLTNVYKKASGEFADSWKDLIYIILFTSQFFVKCVLLYFLYKRIKAKRVIAPTISIEHIVPARWCNMKTYELQHGITTDLTTTYSGVFSPIAHADYFLAFGESSVSPVFGYPIEKVCNVGYAFKQFLKKKSSSKYPENTFLVLSDPEISERIVDTLLLFTKKYPDYIFHIRLHPLEELSDNLKERLANAHVEIADNTINSMLAIMSYHAVIGVNTTVLYEAISVGVKAACISFNGLDPDNYPNPLLKEYFYVISELDDLERFQNNYELSKEQKNYFFSDFNISKFSQLVGF